ncbi:MAG TPA: polysaccharide biosynthesis protein, partial [Ignavibacteria bacterium]|nr:polysaccharide biosynthesis protein [Ignavibacteria bacterium]
YYKYDLIFLIALGFVAVITNLIFIPIYGITGAALASAISVFSFNTARYFFLLFKMKIQPFSLNTIKVLIICAVTFIFNYFIPVERIAIVDILIRSILIASLFGVLIVVTKSSEDINSVILKVFNLIRKKLK